MKGWRMCSITFRTLYRQENTHAMTAACGPLHLSAARKHTNKQKHTHGASGLLKSMKEHVETNALKQCVAYLYKGCTKLEKGEKK